MDFDPTFFMRSSFVVKLRRYAANHRSDPQVDLCNASKSDDCRGNARTVHGDRELQRRLDEGRYRHSDLAIPEYECSDDCSERDGHGKGRRD